MKQQALEREEPQPDWVSGYIGQFDALLGEPAKPFTLLARISVKDGTQGQFERAFAAARGATLRETGVIAFDLNRDATDGTRYLVYERWKSLPDLERHLRSPYVTKLKRKVDEVLAGPPEFSVLVPATERP